MGRTIILVFIAILPVFLICRYIYQKDKNKEPTALLIKLFLFGMICCFLVVITAALLSKVLPVMNMSISHMNYGELLFYTFIGVGLIEEGFKLGMVYLFGYRNDKEFDEIYDIIVYSVFVSLGFALFENVIYIITSNSISIGLLRGVSAVPGHACFALFMGYYLSMAKIANKKKDYQQEKKNIGKSLLIPVLLHGLYDFCLLSGQQFFLIIFIIFIIELYTISVKRLKQIIKENKGVNENNHFCPNCGNKVTDPFCSKCGQKQD